MASLEHGRDAGRARATNVGRARIENVSGYGIVWIRGKGRHRATELARSCCRRRLEAADRPVIPHDREAIRLHRLERIGELIDRVVDARIGTVSAWIVDGQLER